MLRILLMLVGLSVALGAHLRAEEPTLQDTLKAGRSADWVTFMPDGKTLVIRTGAVFRLRNLASGEESTARFGLSGSNMDFSSDGKTLFGGGMLIDVASGKATHIKGISFSVSLAFSPDGKTLVERDTKGGGILVRKLTKAFDGTSVQDSSTISGAFQRSNPLPTFSPDSKTLAVRTSTKKKPDASSEVTETSDASIILWDLASGTKIGTITGNPGTWFGFSPDGKILAAAASIPGTSKHDSRVKTVGCVKLFDVAAAGKEIGILEGIFTGPVVFSPDSKTLAAGKPKEKDHIDLCDANTGKSVAALKAPAGIASAVVFSPDGKTLAALCGNMGSTLQAITLWDIPSGKIVASIPTGGNNGRVTPPAFSPDGKTVAAGCGDGTVKLRTIAGAKQAK